MSKGGLFHSKSGEGRVSSSHHAGYLLFHWGMERAPVTDDLAGTDLEIPR